MNRTAMKLRKIKQNKWSDYKEYPTELNHLRYIKARNSLRALTRKLRTDHETAIVSKIKSSPKAFWKYVSSKSKPRSKINSLDKADGTKATNDQDKADLLNSYFSSVFTVEDLSRMPVTPRYHSGQTLDDIAITEEMVVKKLTKLLPGKSPGPDGWHPRVLKELAK